MGTTALTEAVFYILLSLDTPLHGYGIMQNVEHLSGGRVRLAAGTLYGALATLTERGWIVSLGDESEGRKKEYQITPEGREAAHPWSEKSLREELDNDQAHFLCAVADGCVAGYIGVQEIVGEAYITNVAVSEKFRRRGIAEKLLEEAERGATKRGCVLITLEVRASNDPAKALYKKRGFKEVGTRKNFYSDPREDAEIMTKFFDR